MYSVGFYELLNKVLSFTEKKYAIVINIWKVFSILLEYCCRTDYRMLISEISRETFSANCQLCLLAKLIERFINKLLLSGKLLVTV